MIDSKDLFVDEWYYKNYVLDLICIDNKDKFLLKKGKISFEHNLLPKVSKSLIDIDIYKSLSKSRTDLIQIKNWNRWISLVHIYNNIYNNNYNNKINGSSYILHEILYLINLQQPLSSLHLCEAPGYFIKTITNLYKNIDWYAHSLYFDEKFEVQRPIIEKESDKWLFKNKSGNILDKNIIQDIISNFKSIDKKRDLITADGSIDVSYDQNHEEQLSFKLIFAEVLIALQTLNNNGTFIFKIFNTLTMVTNQLLFILYKIFNKIHIIKPRTTNVTSSEKYVVCLGYTYNQEVIDHLNYIYNQWNEDYHCKNLGIIINDYLINEDNIIDDDMKEHSYFIKKIYKYNCNLSLIQTYFIEKAIKFSKDFYLPVSSIEAYKNMIAQEFYESFDISNKEHLFDICNHYDSNLDNSSHYKQCHKCHKLFI